MDNVATRIISSALTMYDIMEQRVTIVEQLNMARQPFPQMEVLYFCSPTRESVSRIVADFPNGEAARYGNVHLFFTDAINDDLMEMLQSSPSLLGKIKTMKEINLEFMVAESNAFHFDLKQCLPLMYGQSPDHALPGIVARKLATLCISLNEHPCIRYQGNSKYAQMIATGLNENMKAYKRANPTVTFNGDDAHQDRERGQILILDRSFDPLSPIMHEYTYQCMAYDLLSIQGDNVIGYMSTNNKDEVVEKQALLGEQDDLWVELRHDHIAKVIETIKARMKDIMDHNSGAKLSKTKGSDMSISNMAAAVKSLPEFTQTMSKISQHVAVAQQCMDVFGKQGLMDISQCEQTVSTGCDDSGKEVKGAKLVQMVIDALKSTRSKALKKRLVAVYVLSQRVASQGDIDRLVQEAGLGAGDQQFIRNIQSLVKPDPQAETEKKSMFSSVFGSRRPSMKHDATAEGEYSDTRHVGLLKGLIEQMISAELPVDKYPAMGPSISSSSEAKANAKSMRRYGANNRWGKRESNITGSRYMTFVAGGVAYSELRAGYELQSQHSKEIIIGGTHFVSPDEYMDEVGMM